MFLIPLVILLLLGFYKTVRHFISFVIFLFFLILIKVAYIQRRRLTYDAMKKKQEKLQREKEKEKDKEQKEVYLFNNYFVF